MARFINHSCTANLDIHSVFSDSHDIRLPRYARYIYCFTVVVDDDVVVVVITFYVVKLFEILTSL